MVRKHYGKRRNCSLRAISPFPTVFSKDLYCRHIKTRACLGKDPLSAEQSQVLTTLNQKAFINTVGKGKNAVNHSVFCPIKDRNYHFSKLNLSSANALNFILVKILLYGRVN